MPCRSRAVPQPSTCRHSFQRTINSYVFTKAFFPPVPTSTVACVLHVNYFPILVCDVSFQFYFDVAFISHHLTILAICFLPPSIPCNGTVSVPDCHRPDSRLFIYKKSESETEGFFPVALANCLRNTSFSVGSMPWGLVLQTLPGTTSTRKTVGTSPHVTFLNSFVFLMIPILCAQFFTFLIFQLIGLILIPIQKYSTLLDIPIPSSLHIPKIRDSKY